MYALYLLCARFHFVLANNANRKVSSYEQKSEQSGPKPKSLSTTTAAKKEQYDIRKIIINNQQRGTRALAELLQSHE